MLPYEQGRIARILLITFFAALLGYAGYEARLALQGPHIGLGTAGIQTVYTPKILLEGSAERVVHLELNGRPVPLGTDGTFAEEVLVVPGYNVFTLSASDRGGRVSEEKVQVFFEPTSTPSHLLASSTHMYER
jgi:hypothetical protein